MTVKKVLNPQKFIITLLTLCCCLQAFAGNNFQFRTIDVKDGLTDNFVRDIHQDSYGFMWFATLNGLSRYDGYRFKTYLPTSVGHYNNDISEVHETADSTLWIFTGNTYIIYNRIKDCLDADMTETVLQNLGMPSQPDKLFIDDDKNLWVAKGNKLYRYDYKEKNVTSINIIGKSSVLDIATKENLVFALTDDGAFYRVDVGRGTMYKENQVVLPSMQQHHHIYIDCLYRLWIYTAHSVSNKPKCYHINEHRWLESPLTKFMDKYIISSLISDNDGNMWFATENQGVYVCSLNAESEQTFKSQQVNVFSSLGSHINCFYKDDYNKMWIGSGKLGVAFASLGNTLFNMVSTGDNEDVSCILEDNSGNLWMGFDGSGIMMISPNGSKSYYNQQNGKTVSNIITCMVLDSKQNLWAGTYGEGVTRFTNGSFEPFTVSDPKLKSVISYTKCLASDNLGNVWLGTQNNGFIKITPDGSVSNITNYNSEMRSNSILSFATDNDKLFVGTSSGCYVYDITNHKFATPKVMLDELADEFITSLIVDSRGLVWIGTRNGAYVYASQKNTVYKASVGDGFTNNYIRSLVEDENQNIWASSDNGITKISILPQNQDGELRFLCFSYYAEDGLGDAHYFNNASCRTKNGLCLIGDFKGYTEIYPNKVLPEIHSGKAMFTSLYINEVLQSPTEENPYIQENISMATEIKIDHDDNITLFLSSMIPGYSHRIKFMYRIKERKDEWVRVPNDYVSLHGLSPGHYTLEVRYEIQGVKYSDISTIDIIVRPPFWRSGWANLLYFLLAASLVYLYIRHIVRKQKQDMEKQKLEMELKQQYEIEEKKIKFFTNISHDLKTPLTLIIAPLEKILGSNIENKIRVELQLVWRNSQILLDEITQLLDFRKLDLGSEKLYASHGDMVSFVQKTVQGFNRYAGNKNVRFDLVINSSSIEMDFDENKMRRVLNNLLSNAYKYNKDHGSVKVQVGTESQKGVQMLKLQVADTGIGIADKNKQIIFDRFFQEGHGGEYEGSGIGLHIVKEYVSLHGGTITVEDNHPCGSVFTILMPIQNIATEEKPVANTQDLVEEIEEEEEIAVKPKEDKVTLLIVEDNADSRGFLERSLNDTYNVLTAEDGKDAISILRQNDVNIVVSDIMMPRMNGLELCNFIKKDIQFSHIPVVLLSAKSTEENIISGLRDGADDYITKPYSLNILKLKIERILGRVRQNRADIITNIKVEPSKITVSSLDEEFIQKTNQIIEDNMQDANFSVVQLSSEIGMTRGNLYKKLMAISGLSPLEYIRTIRIKRGYSLLQQGKTNVSEVAYSVGYSSKQFSRYFKIQYGCLPSDFIKEAK